MLRWTKPDLQTDNYVIYLKDGHFQKDFQHKLFKGRVELKDSKWMTNGNFSVILQNVTLNDSGTYECYAAYNNQAAKLLNNISLKVEEPDQTGGQSGDGGKEDEGEKSGSVGLIVGLSIPAVLVVIVGVGAVFIYRTCRRRQNPDYQPLRIRGFEIPSVASKLNSDQPRGQSGGKEDEGEKSGSVGLIVGLSISAVLVVVVVVVAVVGFVIYRKCRNSKYQSPSEQGQQMEMS
uniref:uncharacterized protein LOC101485352 isoform X2 n=1 Tax=Maylandia zebra TaxID=106582 RepID=UPI000D30310A|nr:uncharacterized protein LOC101485352 isoform X2 [Maylandia zebra]